MNTNYLNCYFDNRCLRLQTFGKRFSDTLNLFNSLRPKLNIHKSFATKHYPVTKQAILSRFFQTFVYYLPIMYGGYKRLQCNRNLGPFVRPENVRLTNLPQWLQPIFPAVKQVSDWNPILPVSFYSVPILNLFSLQCEPFQC